MPESKDIPVRVALRSRPLVPKETDDGCQECLRFISTHQQVVLGNNKAFTYDFVFSKDTEQEVVYTKAVKPLVDGIFKGYNATVLAYGQTGSGKTYSMGSGYSASQAPNDPSRGVIPRVITSLFDGVRDHNDMKYMLRVSYLEIYNEDIHDLLNPNIKKENIAIRESIEGGIRIAGLREVTVQSAEDMYRCLEQGSVGRTTASTAMNSTSSRSHAIFTIHIDQKAKDESDSGWHAKFHLVDLAGSERVKKTHAEGDRFREGVNINRGLLALGNVISALGDESGRKAHVPYRDAKLTRLLQDSLGGNSQTLMIACVSPADSNMEETLNTLRYADRARRIKNKPIVNRDPKEAEIARLRQQVQQLQIQLVQYSGGALPSDLKNMEGTADMSILLERNKVLEAENQKLTHELQSAIDQTTVLCEKVILAELAKDKLKQKLEELRVQADISIDALNVTMDTETTDVKQQFAGQLDMLKTMQKKILEVQSLERMEQTDLLSAQENDSNSSNEESTLTDKIVTETADDQTFFKHHTLRQAELGRELQELNKALSLKQELVAKMGQSDEKMAVMKMQYEQNAKQLENEVNQLVKEKEQLNTALNAAKTNTTSNKVSEQRRKRLQELEGQITGLKKKILEQNKLLKFKEQSVKAVEKLNKEIHSMKQARVKLMRQMKDDSEKVRVWKAAKNKEVLQLKAQDRKRQCEYAKLERVHTKQQHVLRRKMEEAAAANKRLKEAMQKQKAAAESRGRFDERNQLGVGKRIRSFLEHELEVQVSINEAKRHLASLITDRKSITKQLADLKSKGVPPHKKSKGSDGGNVENMHPNEKALQDDLQVRNAQISDLQQKIVDADQDDKEKSRWKNITSIVEAKCALKWLMETAVVSKVENSVRVGEVRDLQTSLDEATKAICEAKSEMEEVKKTHQQGLTKIQQSHEEKILYLLTQLPQAGDLNSTTGATLNEANQELLDRLHFQEKQISDLHGLHEKLQTITNENDNLKKQLTLANYHGRRINLMPAMTSPDATPSPAPRPVKKPNKKKSTARKEEEEHYTFDELQTLFSSEEESSFMDSDSDWHETPIVRRSRQVTKKKVSLPKDGGCGCKGLCKTKQCRCVKNGNGCSDNCLCVPAKCVNRQSSKDNENLVTSKLNTTVVLDSTTESFATPNLLESSGNNTVSENINQSRKILSNLDSNTTFSSSDNENDVRKRPLKESDDSMERENSDPEVSGVKKKRKLLNNQGKAFFKPLVNF
ncbi:chromosome-associated kinesin KIF4-like [Anneissia japonica]|uniref:chromosome-associated kinesin KIF4-like n=1 Tax=Anneissia japonica TaxID=1529436 RepID=UPI00142570AB|nr:chromosome-associated kinesin KIF4-like [Anneissia japonica]